MNRYIIENWRVVLRSYSFVSMVLGLLALLAPNALYGLFQIEADPYPLGTAALVFFAFGILGRFVRQVPETRIGRRLIFWTAFLFGALMLVKSIGGALYEEAVLSEPDVQASIEAKVVPAMASKPSPPLIQPPPVAENPFDEIAFQLISKWEGKRNEAYRDIVGVWTICYGHTRTAGPGQRKTDAQCKKLLISEIAEYRDKWLAYVNDKARTYWLPPTRKAAYTSLAFNVGWHGAGTSTATRRLNAGDIEGGCEAIGWWNKAGGRVVRGLVRRRTEEVALCLV
ncbi:MULTISPECIES: lysozyme [unclassified Sulfitobacter]|jgi:GH24 family phage-related lysozyme (muramidase)|uniref:lysozyme n=1 Tax=unclassified Sulfitobacter TaxID=196795 RepID=UPI000830C8F0|nr:MULTISPECIES: lysozyme [unclassified Sulfitobacter]